MSKVEQNVMAAVSTIYLARTLLSGTALKLYTLVLSVFAFGKLVWISKVFENLREVAQGGVASVGNFFLAAFEHAHISVQATLLIAVVAAALLAVDLARASAPGSRRLAA